MIIRIHTAHADELIPSDSQEASIAMHILREEAFIEIVVTGRHGSVDSVERRGTYQFESLSEAHARLNEVDKTLHVAEGSMAFVAMINILGNAQLLQGEHATDAQQNLLLQAVFPVTTIQGMGNGTVEL